MEISASVIGLLAIGSQLSSTLHETSRATGAPTVASNLATEVTDFTYTLSKVQQIILGSETFSLSNASQMDIRHLSATLVGSVHTLSELERELSRINIHGTMDFWDRMKWARAEKTFNVLLQRLENHKTTLALILTIMARFLPIIVM